MLADFASEYHRELYNVIRDKVKSDIENHEWDQIYFFCIIWTCNHSHYETYFINKINVINFFKDIIIISNPKYEWRLRSADVLPKSRTTF
jgi:hypothetical protein